LGRTKFSPERLELHHLPHTPKVGCFACVPLPGLTKPLEGMVMEDLVPFP